MQAIICTLIAQAQTAAQDPATLWVAGGLIVGLPLATLGFAVAGSIRKRASHEGQLDQRVTQVEKDANLLWDCHREQEAALKEMQTTVARIDERTAGIKEDLKTLLKRRGGST